MKLSRPVLLVACLALVLAGPARAADTKQAITSAPKAAAAAPAAKVAAAPDSMALLEKSVAKDSTNFDNLYRLGVVYLDRDRVPEATRVLERAVKVKPRDLKALVNLGAAYDAAGKPGDAQTCYSRALEVSPGDSVAMCRMASSLYAQQNYAKAMDVLRQVISGRPNSHCAYFTLGVAFADAGLYRDAIRMWNRVVELAPESPEAISARESMDVLTRYLKGQ